jgi:argininosuccinate synthase
LTNKRVVLAYSGGLDTSVAVRWLMEESGAEVVALAVDVGQGGDFEVIRQRAIQAGAVESEVVDARAEMAEGFVVPAIHANASYEGKYPLVSALSRPVIVRHLVRAAERHGAQAVAHGCTGKGNDQVRFEVGTRALAPYLDILAPARTWGMSREECVAYAHQHDIPVDATKEKIYSIDENLWGRAIECGEMEDPWNRPPDDAYVLTRPTATAPAEIVIGFDKGVPVSLDGRSLALNALIGEVGALVGSYGWGRIDMVENRRVGIKSRETYECPAAMALLLAHRDLEDLTLERDLAHEKLRLEIRWAELVYDGMWFSPLKDALDAFFCSTQQHVTGEVRLALAPGAVTDSGVRLPGSCIVNGRRGPASLYEYDLATYDSADSFHHQDAEGFVRLWGLGIQTWSARQGARSAAALAGTSRSGASRSGASRSGASRSGASRSEAN